MIDDNKVRGAAGGSASRNRARHPYVLATVVSVGVHLVVAAALILGRQPPVAIPPPEAPPVVVTLHRPPPPPPPPPPSEPVPEPSPSAGAPAAAPAPAVQPQPKRAATRPRPPRANPPPAVETLPVPAVAAPAPFPTLGEAQLAGALIAGPGAGGPGGAGTGSSGAGSGAGGPCDMVRRIQAALRADPEVRAAITQAHRTEGSGRALLVWNGDWIQNPGQAGKGLAGVRQAIGLEVAFAPAACRSQSVRGFAVITLADTPGAPRVALGTAAWRWSDLTGGRR